MIEEKEHICLLIDLYQELLTEKQSEIMHSYYFEDYSLSEIAENLDITKQAVKDSIDKARKSLVKFEDVLHLASKSEKFNQLQQKKGEMPIEDYVADLEKLLKE